MLDKKRAGRPVAENPHEAYIMIRLLPAEKALWFAEAKKRGLKMSQWAREILNGSINRIEIISYGFNK